MAIPKKQVRRLKEEVREIPVEDLKHVVGGNPPNFPPMSAQALANMPQSTLATLANVFNPTNPPGQGNPPINPGNPGNPNP